MADLSATTVSERNGDLMSSLNIHVALAGLYPVEVVALAEQAAEAAVQVRSTLPVPAAMTCGRG